jgi:precorrin-6B C5,15-methyltransferase / cobalt-precorrin-6B C5,C15-methyltransferase
MTQDMTQKWLSIVGIGEDGLAGLNPIARSLIAQAEILVGGDRHLAMLSDDSRKRLTWTAPIADSVNEILRHRGQAVCVLASGDPMCYGIGVTLIRQVSIAEVTIVPAASSFSLACARLGWPLMETETLSLCARPLALLHAYLYPEAKLLLLSEGKYTPDAVAQLLTQRGFGRSSITILEHLGGSQERIVQGIAADWAITDLADLNTIAVHCVADAGAVPCSRLAGLPDSAYRHDGQLTKREVRAMTLAALAPLPGELLWDVGAGCGSIAIEWMRTDRRCRAIAIEQNSVRLSYIADNATALGTPNLQIAAGQAPIVLKDLPSPDAVFIGGGATTAEMFETCWAALRSGGRLVANVVTLAGEQQLLQWHDQLGGDLTRIAIQRVAPIGSFLGWRSLIPVTQWVVVK